MPPMLLPASWVRHRLCLRISESYVCLMDQVFFLALAISLLYFQSASYSYLYLYSRLWPCENWVDDISRPIPTVEKGSTGMGGVTAETYSFT